MPIDYDRISHSYDRYRRVGGPYIPVLARVAAETRARCAVELGPGTGNGTAAFLEAHPCRMVGVDPSPGMLARAADKGLPVHWLRGTAEALPLADATADFIFACFVLHHLKDLEKVFGECARVLRGGAAAFVTSPIDFIRRHPLNRYFPSFAAADCARFQSEDRVVEAMGRAGFRDLRSERVFGDPIVLDARYLDRVAGRFVSTLDLLPPGEFEAGLARLRADVERDGPPVVEAPWEALVIWGRRPVA